MKSRQSRRHKKHTRRYSKSKRTYRSRGGYSVGPPTGSFLVPAGAPGGVVRSIGEHVWQAGITYLNEHPELTEYTVQENHPVPPANMHWVYKVVRTDTGIERQTFLNGQRVA